MFSFLTPPQTLRQVTWEGIYGGPTPATDNFTISVHDFSGATPADAAIASFNVGTVDRVVDRVEFNTDIFAYSANVPATSMPAGQYLLAISNDLASLNEPDSLWEWTASSDVDGTFAWRRNFEPALSWGGKGNFTRDDFYFSLSSVPEPSSALVLLGASAMLGLRRRGK